MAVTYTTRLGLPQWSAGTDPLRRAQLETAMDQLELLAGRFEQGLLSARPAAGIRDRYYTATDNGVTYRDTGSAWTVVGAATLGLIARKAAAGQTGNLELWEDASGVDLAALNVDGRYWAQRAGFGVDAGATTIPLTAIGATASQMVQRVRGAAAQSADLTQWQNSAGARLAYVTADGSMVAPSFTDASPILGGSSAAVAKPGWSLTSIRARRCGPLSYWIMDVVRTGAPITSNAASNIADTPVAQLAAALGTPSYGASPGSGNIAAGFGVDVFTGFDGVVQLSAFSAGGGATLATGVSLRLSGVYLTV